ncbi:MAG: VCBS repeat-containing protein, partial [Myxococcota bacterium]
MPSNKVLTVASAFAALAIPTLAASPAHAGGSLLSLDAGALDPQLCGGGGCWTNHLRVTDIDGDDDLDAIFVNYGDFFGTFNEAQPLAVYENDGSGGFTNVSAAAVGGIDTRAHQVCMADVDGDGA